MMSSAEDDLVFNLKESFAEKLVAMKSCQERSGDTCGRMEWTSPTPLVPGVSFPMGSNRERRHPKRIIQRGLDI
jgi:hypothetical protein